MAKTIYKLTEETITLEGQSCKTYGISGDTLKFHDVATDKSLVEEMVERINKEELEECHLFYFIADELDK